ncbi:hypothetical protein C9374_005012 [Naegleria lovaniensis]|uniref:DNA-dependent protein kinase catalytic subunit n=1 Tax=Naegleria lovaniensis TaxID=51637 RepID=A0AA88KKY6_NAELO|nr:uncharacterized protein C9374_005012 [Naegleria lovaniensis]KAG2383045.1 hypothetical protein C9374_005012 [Naegleria lovaniensis]
MLSVAMKISDKYDYFENINDKSTIMKSSSTIVKQESQSLLAENAAQMTDEEVEDDEILMKKLFIVDYNTKVICYQLLLKFVKDNVIQRLHEFKGELLTSCIKFVLSMPKSFIDLKYWVHPLQLSFELGLSYLPLANIGLEAIEYWLKVLPRSELVEKCFPKVLPKLDPYLMVKHNNSIGVSGDDNDVDAEVSDISKLLKGQTKTSIRKTNDNTTQAKNKLSSFDKTPLKKVQLGIIRLLGKIGGDNANILNKAENSHANDDIIITWDTEPRVKFSMPFRDVKMELFFDPVLPRITELAEKSSDRQTKIAACEFLHSIVLYMVGKNAYSPQARQRAQEIQMKQQEEDEKRKNKQDSSINDEESTVVVSSDPTPYYKIYEKLFPVLLRLSVDTEQVTKQLFEPLMFQLVHWLTQNMQYENKETMALLDSIIDSMSNTTDGALRDQCALLLNEFLKWSVKHDRDKKYINVKSLFQRLYSNIHHPNLFKRLGAVIAFNSMYKSFREVDALVQRHVLDWLHNVIISLKIIDNDSEILENQKTSHSSSNSTGIIEKSIQLIGHIERIVVQKSSLLISEMDRRIHTTLADCVDWIFMQCGNGERICREQCMRLFPTLCMLLPGFDTDDGPRRWIHAKFKSDESSVLRVVDVPSSYIPSYGGSIKVKSEKEEKKVNIALSTTATANDISYFEKVMVWLQKLEASFDCLYWLFNHKFLYPHQLFNLEKEHDELNLENKRASSSGSRATNYKKRKTTDDNDMLDDDGEVRVIEDEQEHVASTSCSIIGHIYNFIEKFALKKTSESFILISSSDSEKYIHRKTSTLFKLLNFFGLMLDKYPSSLLSQKVTEKENILENTKFLTLLFLCILTPSKQGFNTNQEEVQTMLPRLTRKILESIVTYSKHTANGSAIIAKCKKILNDMLSQLVEKHIHQLDFTKSVKLNMDDYTFMFRGIRLLHKLDYLDDDALRPHYSSKNEFGKKILDKLFNQHFDPLMGPVNVIICKEMLQMCFEFSIDVDHLLDMVTNTTASSSADNILSKKLSQIDSSYQIAGDEGSSAEHHSKQPHRVKPTTKGAQFYKIFHSEIDTYISEHLDVFSKALLTRIANIPSLKDQHELNHHFLFDVILSVSLKFLRLPSSKKDKKSIFVQHVLDSLKPVLEKCKNTTDDDYKIKTMSLIERLFALDATLILQHAIYQEAIIEFLLTCLKIKRDDSSRTSESESPSNLFDLKLKAIRILPVIFKNSLLSSEKDEVKEKFKGELAPILNQIKKIVIDDFPLNYEEIEVESSEYDDHVSLLEDLLFALQGSDSVEVLEQILPLYRWKNHPIQERMTQSLKSLFGKFTNEKLLKAANSCLETFYKESLPIDIRRQVIQWVCLTCLTHMPERVLIQFFEDNIQRLMKSIAKPTALSEESSNPNIDELDTDSVKALFVTRTCCYNLLEAMYRLLPATAVKEFINNKYCEKTANSSQLTGKELTEKVMRSSFAARSWKLNDQEFKLLGHDLLLDFRTSAFNVLAGGVKCTQTQEKFYTGFLFKEKEDDLWENIVNLDCHYNFEIETNFAFHRKAVDELRVDSNQKKIESHAGTHRKPGELQIGYLSSQYLSDSSLSSSLPIASNFFIPGSKYAEEAILNNSSEEEASSNKPQDVGSTSSTSNDSNTNSTLEMDEINANPCMSAVLRTIDHMVSIFKYPGVSSDASSVTSTTTQTMPSWMGEMHKKLNNDSTHRNIKLFICKVIINRPNVFEPFAKHFFEPIVKLILREEEEQKQSEDVSTRGINYFIRDLLILLLRWKDVSPHKSALTKDLASKLLAFMFKNCAHQKKVILRSNLELIKLMVEKWREAMTINKTIILGWLCHDESKSSAKLARTTGLQLLGIMIANDIPIYMTETDSNLGVNEEQFYEKILDNLSFKNKDVYEAAAEISGMILKSLSNSKTHSNDSVKLFEKLLLARCLGILQKMQYDRFLNCLYKIGIHDTGFIDNFLPTKILDILPNLYGVYKKTALQLISWRAEHITDLYTSLKPFIRQHLQHKDEPTQLLTLQIVYQLVKAIPKDDVMHFMEIITTHINTSDAQMIATFSEPCREKYYDILIWLFDNRPTEFRSDEMIRTELLKAMNDPSEDIRKKMLIFWDHESRLSNESLRRLEQSFTLLFSQNLGDKWLQFSSYLILQLLHRSPDFSDTNAIFSESLSNCVFKEYKIDTSWQHRSLPLTATSIVLGSGVSIGSSSKKGHGTVQSYASLPYESLALEDPYATLSQSQQVPATIGVGMVKATQTPQFTPTQYATETLKDILSAPSMSQTSLLFTPFKSVTSNNAQGNSADTTGGNSATAAGGASGATSESFQGPYLRRRFLKLKENTMTQYQARRAVRLKREKEAWETRQKIAKKNKITMYRKYRTGELPDIQIALKEIITPLQALCLYDVNVSKHLFVSVFSSLYPNIAQKLDEKQAETLKNNIHTTFNQMLKQSGDSSVLMSALMTLCLEILDLQSPKFNILSPKLVRSVSMQSFNVELGILLLESLIENNAIDSGNDEDMIDQDRDMRAYIDAWIELGKLYKSIDEEDVVRSIFEYHVAQQENTKRALSEELAGRYNSALKIYGQGLQDWDAGWKSHDTPPLEEEVVFWREQKLECLKKMNQWDTVLQEVVSDLKRMTKSENITNDESSLIQEKIWQSENSDKLLSLFLDSNLKLKERWSALQHFIEVAMSSNTKRDILESKFCDRLSFLSLFIQQYEKAKSYIVDSYAEFLQSWSSLSPLAKTGRHIYLQKLQPLVEIEEFIDLWQSQMNMKPKKLIQLLQTWKSRYPSSYIDDMNTWDNVVTNRNFMYDLISQNLENFIEKDQPKLSLSGKSSSLRPLTSSLLGDDPTTTLLLSAGSLSQQDYVVGATSTGSSILTMDSESLSKSIAREKAIMYLTVTKAARKQKNNTVAQSYLKIAQGCSKNLLTSDSNSSDAIAFDFEFFKSLVKLLKIKATSKGSTTADTVSVFEKLVRFIKQNGNKYGNEANIPIKYLLTYKLLDADANASFASTLREIKVQNTDLGSSEDILRSSFVRFKESIELVNKHIAQVSDDSKIIKVDDDVDYVSHPQASKIYLKFALFCDNLLKQRLNQTDDDEDIILTRDQQHSSLPSNDQLANYIVENLMNSMKYFNKEARDRFPRLLELLEKYPTTRSVFSKFVPSTCTLQIPSWMFITWISQLLAHLTGPEGECLVPILISIAENYPQSLYYPLNISADEIIDSYEKGNTTITRKVLEGIKIMRQKVKNPLIETFIYSLKKLNYPELRFKAFMDDIKEIMKSKNYKSENSRKKDIKSKWEECYDDVFDPNAPHIGVYNVRFAKNWAPAIKKDFGGRDGEKLLKMDEKTFESSYLSKFKKMKETKGALQHGKTKLEYFSKWMLDFHQSSSSLNMNHSMSSSSDSSHQHFIELPGQYIDNIGKAASSLMLGTLSMNTNYPNMQPPNLDDHVRIISFDPTLLTMSSMRKPKRLKIHGSDEKDYAFLVKGGEDLRQDQRIQQLFHVMNNILDQDANCKQRELSIRMYKVIPMSTEVGIIEWVDNTMPLKAIIEEQLNKESGTKDQEVLKHISSTIHLKMMEKLAGNHPELNLYQKYILSYQKANQDSLTQVMDEQYKTINPDLLRNGLRSLAISNEAYFTIRNRFAKSLATFSICSYILGIGDRHLENFLVDYSSGSLIGIDFGHAFGSATEILPVPELVPFRLTRQLLAVFSPISTTLDDFSNENVGTGLLFESMVHCMRALHNHRHILLNTMDVFIKEPLVDWLKNAKKNPQFYQSMMMQEGGTSSTTSYGLSDNALSGGSSSSSAAVSQTESNSEVSLMKWYPQRKVELAKMKLELANPKVIFKSDVQANPCIKKGIKYVERAIEGDAEINKRAKVGEVCSSVKEQVECLIDMATDVKILGRTYIGWAAQF